MEERRGQGTIFCFVFLPVFVFFVSYCLCVLMYVSFMQAKMRPANGVGLSALSCISGTSVYFHVYLPFLVHIYGTSRKPRGCQCYGYTNARKQEEIKLHEAGIFFVVCIYQWYLTESSE